MTLNFTVTAACAGCGACLATCPERAIRVAEAPAPAPLVVLDTCTGCGECAEVCPVEACVPLGVFDPSRTGTGHRGAFGVGP